MARLQNPEGQARYAGYIVMFVCYFLRIIANEEARAASGSSDDDDDDVSSGDSDTSESSIRYNEVSSSDSGSDRRRSRHGRKPDVFKDARELFPRKGSQKELAKELWIALDGLDEDT
jgi:hypothetical protein